LRVHLAEEAARNAKHEAGRLVIVAWSARAKAKAAGVYKGRPASIDAEKARRLKSEGMGPSAIAKQLKIGRASVYRVLAEAQK